MGQLVDYFYIWRERERERDFYFQSFSYSKLHLPLLGGHFLSIPQNEQGWLGGIFFHHIFASLNIASNVVVTNLVICSAQLMSRLEIQQGICTFIRLVRSYTLILCFQIKV